MPLTKKGAKIMTNMKDEYGKDAEKVFYASKNKGKIKGVDKGKKKKGKSKKVYSKEQEAAAKKIGVKLK